jgi:light-regulated signal transduction histidine kinase (bacteriophytochrome)
VRAGETLIVPQTSAQTSESKHPRKPATASVAELEAALEAERQLRLEAEKRVQRANADFEDFTSKVSHDLREPLRAVSIYCQLISADLSKAEGQPGETEKYLKFVLDGVDRAQNLLASIMEYASVARERRPPVRVDMNAVFVDSLKRVTRDQPSHPVLTSDSLPAVTGDFDALARVMRHLIENAVKFAGKSDPRVHVSSQRDGNDWLLSVQDNGPGIDASHHDTIFSLFKRLHGRDYPGHGIGLAYCKRVVERHGGRIWVASTAGGGSTFYFTLPAFD